MLEVGRICLKTAGREAGRHCVIVKKIDDNFVMVTGPKPATNVKRRRCNILHLEPLEEKIKIKPDASDNEILNEYQKADLFSKLNIEKPSPRKAEEWKAKKKKQGEKKGLKEKLKIRKAGKAEKRPEKKAKEKPKKK